MIELSGAGTLGNIFHDIFGGSESSSHSQQQSQSGNLAYPYISSTYAPMAQTGVASTGTYANLLGLNGGGNPYQNYLNSTGYKTALDTGSHAITDNAASRGLLNSGATLKAEQRFGQNLGSQYFSNYLGQLSDLSKLGLGAGGLISGSGEQSTSSGTSNSSADSETGAFSTFLGALMASDIRLKDNIERIATLPDGLPVYAFDYRRDIDPSLPEGRQTGVMAHEVADKQPWALGPVRDDGFATVDYARLSPSPSQIARFL